MAKAKEEEATGLNERQLQIVGGFEIPCLEKQQQVPLHLMAGSQDNLVAQAVGF
jgi:hypothetical protein